ncbi:hypothetical protein FOL46_000889 [Perkinsus olseni]|uniref:Transmembrane protein 115 n=1 Tax=Perkinsus olseni TaxID=32597 RepID=A0A7J6MFG4_PEROL|nr:hypothetical protein FOL46_000889 [Perkinsus olseni]
MSLPDSASDTPPIVYHHTSSHSLSRILLIGVVPTLSVMSWIWPRGIGEFLGLIPARTVFPAEGALLPVPRCWNLITSSLYDPSVVRFLFHYPLAVWLTSLLEPLWGSKTLVKFIIITAFASGVFALLSRIVNYYVTRSQVIWFQPTATISGLDCALAIGVQQAFPTMRLLKIPHHRSIRAEHLPFTLLVIALIVALFCPVTSPAHHDVALTAGAFISGWVYIRYYMYFYFAQQRGDHSNEFRFAMLFPKVMRPYLDRICGGLYAITTRMCGNFRLRHGRSSSEILPSDMLYGPSATAQAQARSRALFSAATGQAATVATSAKREFEDRRKRALQFLDDNMGALSSREEHRRADLADRGREVVNHELETLEAGKAASPE